jgi:phage tail-like protein
MDLSYPQVGFHFSVVFELFPQFPNDIRFQEVSGLSAEVETESINEGGENRFSHHLPVRTKYSDLVLKRGKFLGSGVLHWCRKAIEFQEYKPTNLIISLLDENNIPLYNWYVVHAIPKKLDISSFNAEQNSIVIETMTLQYHYFKYYDPASTAMDLVGGLTASASINIGF